MSEIRDPRQDPRPGDVVKKHGYFRSFTVERVDDSGSIAGKFTGGASQELCCLSYWRSQWAPEAEVIHIAGGAA